MDRLYDRGRILAALILRETASRFGRSWGGYLWAVAEPVATIAVLSLAFSMFVRTPPLGRSFELFYATGLLPFALYAAIASAGITTLQANKGLLIHPAISVFDVLLARTLLEIITHAAIAALVLPGLVVLVRVDLAFSPAPLAAAMLSAAALGFGVGLCNALLVGFFPTWRQVWAVLNRPMFLASGILFLPTGVPASLAPLVQANPLSHVVALMRGAFYGPEPARFAEPAYPALLSLACIAAAGGLLARHQGRLIHAA
jgi:capsular polysaccharide transport system permease protein